MLHRNQHLPGELRGCTGTQNALRVTGLIESVFMVSRLVSVQSLKEGRLALCLVELH